MSVARETTILWGDSGGGKTSLLGTFALWLYERTGLKSQLVSGDGGGWGTVDHLVSAGIIQAWDIASHRAPDDKWHPFEDIAMVARGQWPLDASDPKSKLAPTDFTKAGIGARLFEGATAFGDMMMSSLSERIAADPTMKLGPDPNYRFADGLVNIGGSGLAHYGIAQRRLQDAVEASRHLPNLYVIWTALLFRGTDDVTRTPVYGPKLPGKAATDDVPRWFGNSFCVKEWVVSKEKSERRVHVQKFFDPTDSSTPYLCKNRIPPSMLDGAPPAYVFLPSDTKLLGNIIGDIENRRAKALESVKSQSKGV